jgi:hypothetical protein
MPRLRPSLNETVMRLAQTRREPLWRRHVSPDRELAALTANTVGDKHRRWHRQADTVRGGCGHWVTVLPARV